ncbi:PH domain-containing protein [Schaalia vaccimaxillae]|uniref:PH domain-containing protein n=1 Tax=Schaalia vaccimaxillae TaxID=183916 RepID=UPI0003B535CF|nr:PH domain-containing protein [Schaalia vaccimaxillae]
MADLMTPEGVDFHPVSPALTKVRIIGNLIWTLPPLIGFAIAAVLVEPLLWIGAGVFALLILWLLWLIPRQVRAMAFGQGADEFCIRKGVMFQSLTLVPYGRIQYVDVSQGPIARAFGIAEIKLNTASVETAGTLNGVPADEAARLRDLLAERGSAELAGL